ncbi:MAG: hypothetical protein AMJ43_00740 [Coxiella sp. DG_40]|nr:MAG: hypothetical protein AMJ43_00740 [Coxiella sp. DG_40]
MATIRRDDGLQFIIRPYRELLESRRTSILKREIRILSRKYGENVRLFKQDKDKFEAVFSRDSGFLLGETIWIYLNKPRNLIYCEALPEPRQALLIVIRDGIVFLDNKMSFTTLIDELISLSIFDEKYDIYVYGDVPLGNSKEYGKFTFTNENVNSFKVLEEPLLSKLSVYEEAQLQPLKLALTSPCLGKSKFIPIVISVAIIVAVSIACHIYGSVPSETFSNMKLVGSRPPVNPYHEYYEALATPQPQQQLIEFVLVTRSAYTLPGWKINNVSYNDNRYTIQLASTGGSIASVQSWAELNNINMNLEAEKIILNAPSLLNNRSQFTTIYPIQQVLGLLIDDINRIFPSKGITFSDITNYQHYKETDVTVNFSKIDPGVLILMGQEIDELPVAINMINITPQDGLFSGDITLKVLGD